MTTPHLHLVACSAGKLWRGAVGPDKTRWDALPARHLYLGDLFAKSAQYVEAIGAPWRILSAKHGLVHPDTKLEPYECTLSTFSWAEKIEWAHGVAGQLLAEGLASHEAPPMIVALAGSDYREPLDVILAGSARILAPMQGLGIGHQKAFLAEAIALAQAGLHWEAIPATAIQHRRDVEA